MALTQKNTLSAGASNVLPAPFDGVSGEYHQWRKTRLKQMRKASNALFQVHPDEPQTRSAAQLNLLCKAVQQDGYALYEWAEQAEDLTVAISGLNLSLGLTQTDSGVVADASGLSLLKDMTGTSQGRFIPYSNRQMNWHTDGYYNSDEQVVRCFSLHCVEPAHSGGTLSIMDYELLLIDLYDQHPELVPLLTHPQAMMLPANTDDLGHDRPDRHVPIIFTHMDGSLGMRFTARGKNIAWRTPDTQAAAQCVLQLIQQGADKQHSVRLKRGQGLFTRNVLHKRDAFEDHADAPKRQMLRGRYTQLPHAPTA